VTYRMEYSPGDVWTVQVQRRLFLLFKVWDYVEYSEKYRNLTVSKLKLASTDKTIVAFRNSNDAGKFIDHLETWGLSR
jgi:hypothetical protein